MADDYIKKIISFLNAHGIHDYHFERLAKHRSVVVAYDGRLKRVVFPSSVSDWRGPANTLANLRHALGPFAMKAPRGRGRIKRPRKPDPGRGRPVACRSFSERAAPVQDRYFGPLRLLKARLEAAGPSANEATGHRSMASEPMEETTSVALRTPWLGRRQRWAII
ncbi:MULTISPECIES: hypothetical protein [unclassified Bradyrhizobium]|uniref:hypothetical protein n=1 Tax=unclassified Bradyrhizobium TaxID=2631580 RepID=UPI001FFBF06A|nr:MULTISPECIES: hypothetical protein [unclassified Bradyrhizobium]MCK1471183.1 hypothetical protein [Bradyrhizobium sp. CW10]UPK23387.1 hypothetical protein IVA73_37895 [Bradyrhizobium sp. 131]